MTKSALSTVEVPPPDPGTGGAERKASEQREQLNERAMKLDSQLCFAMHAASRAFDGLYRVILRETGLTYPQYLVVLVLLEHGELSVKQLGEKLRLDSGTLSPLLKRLEAAGLVQRRRSEADERSVTVKLTAQGERLQAVVCEIPLYTAAATGLGLDEVVALKAQVARLTEALDAAAVRFADEPPPQPRA
jgi:MarR family transcriptional regulator, organic hydroperoxide resistance regulator